MSEFFFTEKYCLYRYYRKFAWGDFIDLSSRNVLAILGLLCAVVTLVQEVRQFVSGLRAHFLSSVLGMGCANLAEFGSWAGR